MNATQVAGEIIGDCPATLDLGNVTEVDEDISDWLGALDLDTEGDVAGNIADWPLSSDWLFDDNPGVGEQQGIMGGRRDG